MIANNETSSAASCIRKRVLLALTQAGVSREDAYRLGAAQRDEGLGGGAGFSARSCFGRPGGDRPPWSARAQINEKFDIGYHPAKHVDTNLSRRVFVRKLTPGRRNFGRLRGKTYGDNSGGFLGKIIAFPTDACYPAPGTKDRHDSS